MIGDGKVPKLESGLLLKAKLTAVSTIVLAGIHWSIWWTLNGYSQFTISRVTITELFQLGELKVNLMPILSRGAVFGAQLSGATLVLTRGASLLFALWLFLVILALVPTRYKSQLIGALLFCAAGFAQIAEKSLGGVRVYFDIGLGTSHLRVFSIYDVVISSAVVYLYGMTLLRFFRVVPRSRPKKLSLDPIPQVSDPLYEKRRPLKALLTLLSFVAVINLVSTGITTWFDLRGSVTTNVLLVSISIIILISAGVVLAPLILIWRVIPIRKIDVIYLRSFRSDRHSWRTARRLRKGIAPKLRLAGVVNPKEARRWFHLLYWLWFPFVFALGDFAQINVTRHNLFIEGDWRAGIKAELSRVRAAVFDCRMLGESLAWEIAASIRILGPKRMFFIMTADLPVQEIRRSLTAVGFPCETIDEVPQDNFVSASNLPLLVSKVQKTCAINAHSC